MGGSLSGVATAHVQSPLSEYGGVDQRLISHRLANIRPLKGQFLNGFHRDEGYVDIRQRLDVVIGPAKERVLEVNHVSFHVDGHDLPRAPRQ